MVRSLDRYVLPNDDDDDDNDEDERTTQENVENDKFLKRSQRKRVAFFNKKITVLDEIKSLFFHSIVKARTCDINNYSDRETIDFKILQLASLNVREIYRRDSICPKKYYLIIN